MRFRITVTGRKTVKQIEKEEKSRRAELCLNRPLDDKVYQNAALREQYAFHRLTRVLEKRFWVEIFHKDVHLKFAGGGAGNPNMYKESPYDPEHPLDFEFFEGDKLVALIEISGSDKYDDLTYPFPAIPIRRYKIEAVEKLKNKVPTFYVFIFWMEFKWLNKIIRIPKDYWTTYEKARKCPKKVLRTNVTGEGERQKNYMVPLADWTIDIDSLAKELSQLVSEVPTAEKKP